MFVLDEDQDRGNLVRQCLKIGYENLEGELAGGMAAWRSAGLSEARIAIEPIEGFAGGPIVDVRQQEEFDSGHLPGALHVELGVLTEAQLPRGPLAVHCGHGERAMSGASLLRRAGRRELTVLLGGPDDWSRGTGRGLERA